MAGVDVGGGGGGGRKSLDSDINMIPFIDLLFVTIAFLLITAVWTHMARLEADAQVQSQQEKQDNTETPKVERVLYIEMMPDKFVLTWKEGGAKVEPPGSIDVPRPPDEKAVVSGNPSAAQYGELAAKIKQQWHDLARPQDNKKDLAILHTDNQTEYKFIIGVMDALYATKRIMGPNWQSVDCDKNPQPKCESAFNVTFTSN